VRALRLTRWEIELVIDEIKDHQRLSTQPLRSRRPLLVLQELYALLLAHYAVRTLMFQAAGTGALDPDRVSFTEGIHILKRGLNLSPFLSAAETDRTLSRLHIDLVNRHVLLPPRRLRFNCRVVKQIQTRFHRKKETHKSVKLPASQTFADLVVTGPPVDQTDPFPVQQPISV
jgi:hypothetical protein